MKITYRFYSALVVFVLLLGTAAGCTGPSSDTTATPASASDSGGSNNNPGSTQTPTPTPTPTPSPTPTLTPTPTPSPTPTQTATPSATPIQPSLGPFTVKQIVSLGHETIAGSVCNTTKPFVVTATAPEVTFVFNFVPASAQNGQFTYAYSIPSAGESHDAKGKYTLAPQGKDGSQRLTLSGSDHVAFHGFDGPIPIRYYFDLVPDMNISCPG